VVIIGQPKALGIAVGGGPMKPRWTKLKEWLSTQPSHRALVANRSASRHC
jgi:exodeoxyribonuclease V alpha subunit